MDLGSKTFSGLEFFDDDTILISRDDLGDYDIIVFDINTTSKTLTERSNYVYSSETTLIKSMVFLCPRESLILM